MEKFLIAGLGNPGARYAKTRHNAGADFVDELSVKWGLKFEEKKSIKSYLARYVFKNKDIYLIKPIVFMNNSGNSLKPAIKKYNLNLASVLIVHDDLDLPSGSCKLKKSGGDGGHNGLKSINDYLGSNKYCRLRFGIGNNFKKGSQTDFVLEKWSDEELKSLPNLMDHNINIIFHYIKHGSENTMNKFN